MIIMTAMKFAASQNGAGKIMQFYLVSPLAEVDLAHPVGVDGVTLVRVDDNLTNSFFTHSGNSLISSRIIAMQS